MTSLHGPRDVEALVGKRPGSAQMEELMYRCSSGDEQAFEEIYRATASRVFGLALRVVIQPALAEEVSQEVFSYLWTHADRFDPSKGAASTWILTLTHRRAVDRVRRAHASRERDTTWTRNEMSTPFDSTAEAVHASVDAARVREALNCLSTKQRTALHLAYYGGLTHSEVAARLGIPHGTAKTRIRDGLRSLAIALEPDSLGLTR